MPPRSPGPTGLRSARQARSGAHRRGDRCYTERVDVMEMFRVIFVNEFIGTAILIVLANIVVDFVHALLDPRIRLE